MISIAPTTIVAFANMRIIGPSPSSLLHDYQFTIVRKSARAAMSVHTTKTTHVAPVESQYKKGAVARRYVTTL
jgi:hypothetical protein